MSRARMEALVERLIARLDELDGDPDREPEHEGEADVEEGSAQRATLAPDWMRPVRGRAAGGRVHV